MKPIAHIECGFHEKFGIPRQSGLAGSVRARVVFEPEYRIAEALRGLEGFEYIWLIWEFSENGDRWSPTVRPPRLGGNRRMGVFATRSGFRPNPIGLSSVRLEAIVNDAAGGGTVLEISGSDLMDGTPVYDIKPYIPYADSHPEASAGWVDTLRDKPLDVKWEQGGEPPEEIKAAAEEILSLDPRPRYIDDPERLYHVSYGGYDLSFKVEGDRVSASCRAVGAVCRSRTMPLQNGGGGNGESNGRDGNCDSGSRYKQDGSCDSGDGNGR